MGYAAAKTYFLKIFILYTRLVYLTHGILCMRCHKYHNSSNTVINNSNWTECSTVQEVIVPVISKSDEHKADLILQAQLHVLQT